MLTAAAAVAVTGICSMVLTSTACGPGRPVPEDPFTGQGTATVDAGAGDGLLPSGKVPAVAIEPPSGVLITKVDEEQLGMVYAQSGPFSPQERLARAMQDSKIAWRREPIGAAPSRFHEIFGGMREPDPFLVVGAEGDVHVASPYDADPDLLAQVEKLFGSIGSPDEQDKEFCEAIGKLIEKDPLMPMLHERLAGCLQQTGHMKEAIAALEAEVKINPSSAGAHMALAAVRGVAGDVVGSRNHLVLALLYYPAFEEPRTWVNTSGTLPATKARVQTFGPRVSMDVDDAGFVVIRSPANQPWAGSWAECKAAFRYSPEVRMAFGMTAGAYKPSLLEEMVCMRIAADAYREGVVEGGPVEVIGDAMVRATGEERLVEAAFFEIIGHHDPDLMKMLPEHIEKAVKDWIEDTVLIEQVGEVEKGSGA